MLRFYTAGESHGQALLAFVSGLPASLPVSVDFINHELHRRQLGYGRGGRQKIEKDRAEIFAGVRRGETIGAPIAIRIENRDWANWEKILPVEALPESGVGASDLKKLVAPRPGHADLAGSQKFNFHDARYVLERASARETAARVAAGALAKQLLREFGTEIASHSVQVGHVKLERAATWNEIWMANGDIESPLRCVDAKVQEQMKAEVDAANTANDTVGGVFEVVVHNVPVGLGSHAQWDEKLDGRLAQAILSIQAVKGMEIGAGIAAAEFVWQRSAGRDFVRQSGEEIPAVVESSRRIGRRHHERRRYCGARISEADFDVAQAAGNGGHGDEGADSGGVRAVGLVRGAGGGGCGRGDGGTCPGGCFSAKIWRRLPPRDEAEFRKLCPTS